MPVPTPFYITWGVIMITCPECGKEIIPIVNAVASNINGCAAQPVVTHLNLVFDTNNAASLYTNFANNGCNPVGIPQIVTIPLR